MSLTATTGLDVRIARDAADIHAAQQLRYAVFIKELGGDGPLVDHEAQVERDRFDPFVDHLVVFDGARAVGVYRVMRADQAAAAGGFYSANEYDLTPLLTSGRRVLELGRSCLHPDYRGGMAMHLLWGALARYIADHGIAVLFGVASFHGTDVEALKQPLSLLHHRHLAPPELRVRALEISYQDMNLIAETQIDRKRATRAIPSLIKAYLRLGGMVGEGAFVDRQFNTVDVCLILDTTRMNARQMRLYGGTG
ncbi:GNAT family N-acetyltransferase [Sulfitobacter sp. JB4-11]|uniref:GNAT family N-acetyltransferase n=1 Tax=Sulfitobacter rhodophyticola TaxID=3238304 RepID=UPI003516C0C2